nr:peroxisome proliferator-activated receptor gamma coactivator-related protein 1-like [Nerophis lumbriciformis]
MAVRWGAGEDTLTACNMDFFPLDTLGEPAELCSGETPEVLQNCLDPSILSIFDDTLSIENKGLDEAGESTLLTALAEILDSMDDENPSPFDTLPESDLLSGLGREHSPHRRSLCLPRYHSEKASFNSRPLSTGKNLPKMTRDSLQRSDGEEDDVGSLTLSPLRPTLPSDCTLSGRGGLTIPFPAIVEQESGASLSVSLCDFVKHMHSYCRTVCMEDAKGMEMLPEEKIAIEAFKQGANGEILDTQDPPVIQPIEQSTKKVIMEEEIGSDSSEHIVVDDDDEDEAFCQDPKILSGLVSKEKDNILINMQKEDSIVRRPSRRKRKKKCKKNRPPVQRVLRSATMRDRNSLQRTEIKQLKRQKKNKMPKSPAGLAQFSVKPKEITLQQKESQPGMTTLTPKSNVKAVRCVSPQATGLLKCGMPKSESPTVSSQEPDKMSKQVLQAPGEHSSQLSLVSPSEQASAGNTSSTLVNSLPHAATAHPEPKPKSLSLAEYRQLRLQKKPVVVEMQSDNSTKWPTLPELPKELPAIPCLTQTSSRDPRRSTFKTAKEVAEVKPAWQPWGPCAPATPEALLVPPAYIVASTKTANAVPTQAKLFKGPVNLSKDKCPKLAEEMTEVTENPLQLAKDTSKAIQCNSASTAPLPTPLQETPHCQNVPKVVSHSTHSSNDHNTSIKASITNTKLCSTPLIYPLNSQSLNSKHFACKPKPQVTTPAGAPKAKSPTQELIESFTTEMGIEAADLTSLLEQFEETQGEQTPFSSLAKEQQSVPEVYGRAAAVGNSSAEFARERMVVERVRANDLSSPAALTPPATPPHQMWKPLTPINLLGKAKASQSSKTNPSKAIQIEARPLTSARLYVKPTVAAATVPYDIVCMDHDYCLPTRDDASTGKADKCLKVKQQITIKLIQHPAAANTTPACVQATTCQSNPSMEVSSSPPEGLDNGINRMGQSSVLETPEASPTREESESTESTPRKRSVERYRQHSASRSPSPKRRGQKRRSRRSPSVSSSSESDSYLSRSPLPSKKRFRNRSGSSSRSSSLSSVSRSPSRKRKYSYSSSNSSSRSRSRSRSHSPQRRVPWRRTKTVYSSSYRGTYGYSADNVKSRKDKAIEERRVVYIGRIRGTMTQRELRERFSYFGEVEDCTLHFREHGDNYGFVTYYDTKDAFTAIENGSKLRKPDELPFELCFGGRRQFCKTTYADLDSSRDYDPASANGKMKTLDFDTLLKQAQRSLRR